MIEELNKEAIHVCCVRQHHEGPRFVAHCFELDLISDGSTEDEAISRLKTTVKIQCHVCEARSTIFLVDSLDAQWIQCHQADPMGSPEETNFVIQKIASLETVDVNMKIDKTHRIIANKDGWPSEYPLHKLKDVLSTMKIFWQDSEELDYGYFWGHWPAGSDGPLQSYPFYAPCDTSVQWYHLRNIASRFWFYDLKSYLV